MGATAILLLFFAGVFLGGIALIRRVPARLHTPLMSMTNAVSGITVLAAILLFARETSGPERGLGAIAIAMGAFNLVGGFLITARMVGWFRRKGSSDG